VITAATGIAAGWWLSRTPDAAAPIEFTFGAPPGHTFVTAPPAVSPDGRYVAFVASDDRQSTAVWIRSLSERSARRIDTTAGTAAAPRWSPDSRSLLFLVGGTWKRTNIAGGPALTVLSDVVASLGASWNSNDEILLATANRTSLSRVRVSGSSVQQVTTLDPNKENSHRWPTWLPDNHHFLFTVRSDRPENLGIKLGSLDSAEVRPLVNMPSPGVYAKPGYLLFMTPDEVLMAQRLDPSTWTLQGEAQPIAAPVSYNGPSFAGLFDASFDGRIVAYLPASRVPSSLAWFDRTGKSTGRITAEQFYLGAVRVSPDGHTIAVELADERYGTRDLWLIDASTQALTRLTTNPATDWRPVFAPDGATIAFASDRAGASTIFRVATAGGAETVVYRAANGGAFPYDWSRDGKYLLATIDDQRGRADQIVMIPVDGSPAITLIDSELGRPSAPRFSPDGTHVAFVSDANGTREVYVMSIRDRRRVRVSTEGGFRPLWGGDGRELFFQNMRNEVMRAVLASDGSGVAVKPELLFVPCASVYSLYVAGAAELAHDVTADGTRFLFNCQSSVATPSEITVLVNWQSRLR
jgi:Tol biopolymer transport system component